MSANVTFEADQFADESYEREVPIGDAGWTEDDVEESRFVVIQNGAAAATKDLDAAQITVAVSGTNLLFTTAIVPADLEEAVPGRLGWEWWATIDGVRKKRASGPFILHRSTGYQAGD